MTNRTKDSPGIQGGFKSACDDKPGETSIVIGVHAALDVNSAHDYAQAFMAYETKHDSCAPSELQSSYDGKQNHGYCIVTTMSNRGSVRDAVPSSVGTFILRDVSYYE